MEQYQTEYNKFIEDYKLAEVSGEETGILIARLAQYFAKYNMEMVANDKKRSIVAKDIESRADENGKAISSTKAAVLVEATPEAHEYKVSRAHLQNIEQMINSLKALQKGILNEYNHSSLT